MRFYKTLTLVAAAVISVCAFGVNAQEAPKQALREVPFTEVNLDDNFWAPRIEANRVVSVIEDDTRTHLSGVGSGYFQPVNESQTQALLFAMTNITPIPDITPAPGDILDLPG